MNKSFNILNCDQNGPPNLCDLSPFDFYWCLCHYNYPKTNFIYATCIHDVWIKLWLSTRTRPRILNKKNPIFPFLFGQWVNLGCLISIYLKMSFQGGTSKLSQLVGAWKKSVVPRKRSLVPRSYETFQSTPSTKNPPKLGSISQWLLDLIMMNSW